MLKLPESLMLKIKNAVLGYTLKPCPADIAYSCRWACGDSCTTGCYDSCLDGCKTSCSAACESWAK